MAVQVKNDNSKLDSYAFPGGYDIIYWTSEDYQDEPTFALCGDCANDERFRSEVKLAECAADYEHDLPCENCGKLLAECYLKEDNLPCEEGCNNTYQMTLEEVVN